MDLKGKSILLIAVLIVLIGSVSADDVNDTIAIENTDLSISDTFETISVNDNVQINTNAKNNSENNFEVIETNNIENESNDINSVTTVTTKTFEAIQAAVDSANAGDTIKLIGTYIGSGTKITVDKNLSFVGENQATLDAKTLSQIIYVNTEIKITFTNITFKNGITPKQYGGAVYLYTGFGNFTGCNFISNTAELYEGGAVYIYTGKPLYFTNCNFISNTAGKGGAFYLSGGGYKSFTNCNFTDNTATDSNYGGGAIYIGSGSNNYFTDCNFKKNTATITEGGALYILGSGNFTRCNFTDNTATSYNGQTIYIYPVVV